MKAMKRREVLEVAAAVAVIIALVLAVLWVAVEISIPLQMEHQKNLLHQSRMDRGAYLQEMLN